MTSFFSNALKSIKKRLKKTPLGRFELTIGQPLIIKPVLYHIAIQLLWSVGLNGNDYKTLKILFSLHLPKLGLSYKMKLTCLIKIQS